MAACTKCKVVFAQRADVWPQGFCEHCRLVQCPHCELEREDYWTHRRALANRRPFDGELLTKDKREKWLQAKAAVEEEWKEEQRNPPLFLFERDPFEYGGGELCKRHRGMLGICHGCGGVPDHLRLEACPKCYDQHVSFCIDCYDNRKQTRKLICIPESDKIAPSYLVPVDFRQIIRTVISCPLGGKMKPLVTGQDNVLIEAHCTLEQAKACASACYQSLVDLIKILAKRYDKSSLENTFAVSLLENDAHFKMILTYSDYSKANVSSKVRELFPNAVIDADPFIVHGGGGVHWLHEVGPPFQLGDRGGARYKLNDFNLHHAEMRATIYATKRQYSFHYLAPTRVCCAKCKIALTESSLLQHVPVVMREPNKNKKNALGSDGDDDEKVHDIDEEEKKQDGYDEEEKKQAGGSESRSKKPKLVNERAWIEGDTITLVYDRLATLYPTYRFVDPVVAHQIGNFPLDSADAAIHLNGLNLNPEVTRIFFPINNGDERNGLNGTHWTLLVFDREQQQFQYYDTAEGRNGVPAPTAIAIMNHLIPPEDELVFVCPDDTPQQQNGDDCGVFVISITENLASAYAAGEHPVMKNVEPPAVTRNRLRELELD